MPKLLVRSAVAVRCESSRGRLRPRLFNLLDFRPYENREFSLCSVFCVSPEFRPTWLFACFSITSLTLPFIFDFGVKIARTLCVFCTVLISVGYLPYLRNFSFKTAVVIGLFSVKTNAAWRAFCTVLGRGRVFPLPRTFFFKILGSRLTF